MALFVIMVLAPVALPSFEWFVATRVVGGALQGVFLAAAFTTAIAVVPGERAGRAVAVVITGFSISTVLGLPVSVLVGTVLGWRGALLVVGGSALVATALLVRVIPNVPGSRLPGGRGMRHALGPRVLLMLALSLTLFAATGAVTGYLLPLLHRATGVSGPLASAVLVAYGVANVAGSLLGGRLADADAGRALVLATLALVASSTALFLAGTHAAPALVALLVWAVSGSSAP